MPACRQLSFEKSCGFWTQLEYSFSFNSFGNRILILPEEIKLTKVGFLKMFEMTLKQF